MDYGGRKVGEKLGKFYFYFCISRGIDLLVKEIQKSAGKGIKIDIVNLLVDLLKYIKIRLGIK